MNRQRLKQARERLMTVVDPERFNMKHWQMMHYFYMSGNRKWNTATHITIKGFSDSLDLNKHTCGTAGCFAGWLPAMFKDDPEMERLLKEDFSWSDIVEEFFELEYEAAEYLYSASKYFRESGGYVVSLKNIKPIDVCDHIDTLLENEEVK